jgi:hypothetical protein
MILSENIFDRLCSLLPGKEQEGPGIRVQGPDVQVCNEYFSRQYSFWRPYVEQVIYRYLDCGDLHNGFARVKCKDCGHEYLLAIAYKHCCFELVIFNLFSFTLLFVCRCNKYYPFYHCPPEVTHEVNLIGLHPFNWK